MRRHKPPTLVSMWMLDVFCCALGCVTILWLLKAREAGRSADEAAAAAAELATMQDELASTLTDLLTAKADAAAVEAKYAAASAERDELKTQLAASRTKLATTETDLASSRGKADDLAKSLASAEKRVAASDDELAKKAGELAGLAKSIADAKKKASDLESLVREREKARDELDAKYKSAAKSADDFDAKYRAASKTADDLDAKYKAAMKSADELAKERADAGRLRDRIDSLEKELRASGSIVGELKAAKSALADKVSKLETESDQRFAGINLTGEKVVFLVDMSGSMDRTDYTTPDATKWPTVRETLLKVMRSLPTLKQFQVILFSDKVQYLMPDKAGWIEYAGDKSLAAVKDAMAKTKPSGDTNMYLAFDEAFKFRADGLDTVYLFSDGLPTSGPTLTAAQLRDLKEAERTEYLSKQVRQMLKADWNRELPRRPKVKINSIGFFYESPDVGAFLWSLSRDNDGSFVGMNKP